MPRKVKQEVIEDVIEEVEEVEQQEVQQPLPKKLSDKRLESLQRAREVALIRKQELKENKQKAKGTEKLELEIKAIEYDRLLQKKQALQEPTKAKKVVKKVIQEVEESESETESEEEVVVKRFAKSKDQKVVKQKPNNYNQLLYQSATQQLQEKLLDERAKSLINSMMPSRI